MTNSTNDVYSLSEPKPMLPKIETWNFPIQHETPLQANDWLHQDDHLFISPPPQPPMPQQDDAFSEFFPAFSGNSNSYIPNNANYYSNDCLSSSPAYFKENTQWNPAAPLPVASYSYSPLNEPQIPQKQVHMKTENSQNDILYSPSHSQEEILRWYPELPPSPPVPYHSSYSFPSGNKLKSSSLEKIRTQREESSCSNCKTTSSTMWRWNLTNGERECNACNLYEKKNGRRRPSSLWKKVLLKRNRKGKD